MYAYTHTHIAYTSMCVAQEDKLPTCVARHPHETQLPTWRSPSIIITKNIGEPMPIIKYYTDDNFPRGRWYLNVAEHDLAGRIDVENATDRKSVVGIFPLQCVQVFRETNGIVQSELTNKHTCRRHEACECDRSRNSISLIQYTFFFIGGERGIFLVSQDLFWKMLHLGVFFAL